METIYVKFMKTNMDIEDEVEGIVKLENGQLKWHQLNVPEIAKCITEPMDVTINYEVVIVDPKKEPEKFIKNLYRRYHGDYYYATRPYTLRKKQR